MAILADISQDTMMFQRDGLKKDVATALAEVSAALREKGYNPVDQLVGYLLSGDPTYITNYKDARMVIRQFERYELLEEVVQRYLRQDEQR